MEHDKELPAEPVVGDKGTDRGGFAAVAERLNERYPDRRRPISRQLVHKWYHCRHANRFPEAVDSKGRGNGGEGRPLFDLADVMLWYEKYTSTRNRNVPSGPARTQYVTGTQVKNDGESMAA